MPLIVPLLAMIDVRASVSGIEGNVDLKRLQMPNGQKPSERACIFLRIIKHTAQTDALYENCTIFVIAGEQICALLCN